MPQPYAQGEEHMKEALKLALDYIVATNKSSEFRLVPASNLNNVVTAIKEAFAQPVQERVATMKMLHTYGDITPPEQEPRNFCPRCGKRTPDLTTIHTCTPPEGGHQ